MFSYFVKIILIYIIGRVTQHDYTSYHLKKGLFEIVFGVKISNNYVKVANTFSHT